MQQELAEEVKDFVVVHMMLNSITNETNGFLNEEEYNDVFKLCISMLSGLCSR